MSGRRGALAVAGAAALAALGLAACGPSGGTVRVREQSLFTFVQFTAAAGKANDVSFTSDGADVLVHDAGDTLRASDGCTNVDASTARCTGLGSGGLVTMDLRDGDDVGTNASTRSSRVAIAGEGVDVAGLKGGPGDDVLTGGPARDLLVGDEGEDELDGGGGDDTVAEGVGAAATEALDADTFVGGPGVDKVDYTFATSGVRITLRGDADDGRPGEGDNVQPDVENGTGGAAGDTLIGNDRDNVFLGGAGNDSLVGGRGADDLSGQADDDVLSEAVVASPSEVDALDADTYRGGSGNDKVSWDGGLQAVRVDLDDVADDGRTGEGDDVASDVERLTGGAGSDTLVGDQDDNELNGGGRGDFLIGNEGRDRFFGGEGDDVLSEGAGAAAIDGLDADRYEGDGGTDTVNYTGAALGVSIDLDGVADDGRPSEGDEVRPDVERINGGNGGDTLTGDGDPNTIIGNGGADDIDGAGGNDVLRGSSGVDALDGGPQTDDCDVGVDGGTEVNCEA